jgi:hypothetical protein
MNGDVIDRKQAGRKRARYTAADAREEMLQIAFQQISVSKPEQLHKIIDRCNLFLRIARVRGDKALETHALLIGERALRRLKSIQRRGARA